MSVPASGPQQSHDILSSDMGERSGSGQRGVLLRRDSPIKALADHSVDGDSPIPNVWQRLPTERHIRLLKLHAVREEYDCYKQEMPECSLEVVHLDAVKSQYEALSYAWGDKEDGTRLISLDGLEVVVWKNLHQALVQLQPKTATGEGRRLWVDALSIDQYDMEERANQILLMHDIFRQASQVLIWVGEQDQAAEHVLRGYVAILHHRLTGDGAQFIQGRTFESFPLQKLVPSTLDCSRSSPGGKSYSLVRRR